MPGESTARNNIIPYKLMVVEKTVEELESKFESHKAVQLEINHDLSDSIKDLSRTVEMGFKNLCGRLQAYDDRRNATKTVIQKILIGVGIAVLGTGASFLIRAVYIVQTVHI